MTYKQRTKTSFPRDHWIVNPQKPGKFSGFPLPDANFTMIPNALFEALPGMTGNDAKVLLYIARQTLGFHKIWDAIGLRQFGLGIDPIAGEKSDFGIGLDRKTVIRSIKRLEKNGFITAKRERGKRTIYRLKFEKPRKAQTISSAQNATTTSAQNATTQKKTNKEYNVVIKNLTEDEKLKEYQHQVEKTLIRFLSEQDGVRNPQAFLNGIKKKYGSRYLPMLIKINFEDWTKHLDYYEEHRGGTRRMYGALAGV